LLEKRCAGIYTQASTEKGVKNKKDIEYGLNKRKLVKVKKKKLK